MKALNVTLDHVLASSVLPSYHRGPFDRLLVAQGQVESLTIVTHDPRLRKYAVETIW
jgi:PIN domain nuclease of toxin-antitoxin system